MGNTSIKTGSVVLLVAAAGEVIPSLVAGQNNDGSLNLVHISNDKSKHPLLGSADFHHAIERRFGVPHGLDKFNELQKYENGVAEKEGRAAKAVDQHDALSNTHDIWAYDSELSTSTDSDGVTRVSGFYFTDDAVAPYVVPPPAAAETPATASTAAAGGTAVDD